MKFYNTLSQKKEEFVPVHDGSVGMYVCGPTVYDVGHLGHARAAVAFDLIRRYLLYRGFQVTFVSNITDVDDKMIKRSAEEGITEAQLAEKIIPEYNADYGALHVLPPDHQPRATQYIKKMVALVENLMKKGAAYATEDGVYFEVRKFSEYGKLSHKKLDELQAGARIEIDEKKKNPEDFALWKRAKEGEPEWKGPRLDSGESMMGRPGWHIECSAMSMDILGETFDIHGGGIDLQFPHHENEITQSEMATGRTFARYWLHNGHVKINSEKMSKSLGNFFTMKEMFAQHNPVVVRYVLISSQYRMPIDFSEDLFAHARASLTRLHDFMRRLKGAVSAGANDMADQIEKTQHRFRDAMDDDFEISEAMAAIFDFVKEVNAGLDRGTISKKGIGSALALMHQFDSVLAVLEPDDTGKGVKQSSITDEEISELIVRRNDVRSKKDFASADAIRAELEHHGIILEDAAGGTEWKRAL